MDFLIFCPPRSRTAWLANFLTYENAYCYHEALAMVSKVEDLKDMKRGDKVTGNSDSGLFLFPQKILDTFPDAKVVLVKRDKGEIRQSLMELFDPDTSEYVADICVTESEWMEKEKRVMTVEHEELNKESTCRNIWELCTGSTFDSERWKMLDNFNVQLHKIEFDQNQIDTLLHSERSTPCLT